MRFNEYKHLDLANIAEEILKQWEHQDTFLKSIKNREGKTPFIFYEGPPSANGIPGIHHVMARAIKDIFCRYKTQKGFQVDRKAGWDTHGLPVELGVEKELGITKDAIGKSISVEEYNNACKKAVMRYTDVWNELTKRIGYWVDMEDPYVTYTSKYMESVWWLIKQIYEKDLLYKGYTIQPYSPMAGTGLSSHELNQPGTYQDVTDTTVTAQFKTIASSLPEALKDETPLYFLAWTTTPWTLPSNTALTVGKKIDYVVVNTFNQYTFQPVRVILAKDLVSKQFGKKYVEQETLSSFSASDPKIPYRIETTLKGSALLDIRYEQLWSEAPLPLMNPEDAFRVIAGDFVTTEDGTGIVHTAPTFGADDAKVAKEATPEIPPLLVKDENENLVPLVDLQGRFRKEVGRLGGQFVKNEYYPNGQAPKRSTDVDIAIQLKEENKAFKVEKYVHSYPNCWRTDKPILYYPLDSWFIKVTDVKNEMVSLNKEINWKPKATGEGRFGNWLANANDWNLSRSRFWGIPLPVWRTEDGKETRVIGSIEELKNAVDESVSKGLMDHNPLEDFIRNDFSDSNYDKVDLHKHSVDRVILCSSEGEPMSREADLIDVWFDSGSMPYAQWHYPFENKELIDQRKCFPADYIAEGVDQTRGWFYTLHAIATLVFGEKAYKNVVSNGLVLDKNGQKMSKRLGNAVDPFETLDQYGPDATRWYMISNANPWDNLKFDIEGIAEVRRKFFGTLYNTYSFFSLYANIDRFTPEKEVAVPYIQRPELDQWILSELHSLITEVDAAYEDYEPTKASRAISDFVQEKLSNWYVRLCRRRFWKGDYGQDKIAAYQTLHECLVTVCKLAAPVAPFYMDHLYQDLTMQSESIHLTDFPQAKKELIQPELEQQINTARTLTSLALSLRKKEQIKVRQPLHKMIVPVKNNTERKRIENISLQLKGEINIKEVELLDDANSLLVKEIKPNFKTLGPRFGKNLKAVTQAIKELSPAQIQQLEDDKNIPLDINGEIVQLEDTDVEVFFKDIEGWQVAQSDGLTVALDMTLTPALVKEGLARELVNRIQNHRKDSGLEVTDKIEIYLQQDAELEAAVSENKSYILSETLATALTFKVAIEQGIPLEFDTIKTTIQIKKLKS
ncbi:isoleucine--tRNA ligase [Flavobacteriaceae bacterium]|nr:isoleucine--tRNA ligase [Flavobacteriaceae bacterium]